MTLKEAFSSALLLPTATREVRAKSYVSTRCKMQVADVAVFLRKKVFPQAFPLYFFYPTFGA